jgi:hypothetical protein
MAKQVKTGAKRVTREYNCENEIIKTYNISREQKYNYFFKENIPVLGIQRRS